MSGRSKPRSPFVITVAVAALASACGGSTASDGGGSGGVGGATTNPPPPNCPVGVPTTGSACPEVGAVCEYFSTDGCGQTATTEATCKPEGWSVFGSASSCNPPPPPLADCPSVEPTLGQYCNVVAGKTCAFPGLCCSAEYTCQAQSWVDVSPSCNPPAALCPGSPPASGAACDACAGSFAPCIYDACGDGGVTTSASCENGAWNVNVTPCTGAADGGV